MGQNNILDTLTEKVGFFNVETLSTHTISPPSPTDKSKQFVIGL